MRANMARALMSRADVLMLDEPTNHLDLDAVLWLEHWLQRFPGTLLLVSHDREFLDDIVNRIVNLENGQLTHWTGNYTDFQRQHAASIQQSAAMAARQERETARLHSFIDRFRAQASKARQVQSRIKALSKLETIATYQELDTFEWEFAAANKLPQPLVTLDGAAAGYGERTVISGVGRSVNPGERIGILGRNGAGKSTLMKLISGALPPPRGGERVASPDLIVGNFAQLEVDRLDSRDTALVALTNRIDEIGARIAVGRAAPPQSSRRLRLPRRPRVRAGGAFLRRRTRAAGARDPGRRAPQPAAARRAHQPSRLRDAPFADHRAAGFRRRGHRRVARSRPAAQRLRPVLAGGRWRGHATSKAISRTTPTGWRSAAAPPSTPAAPKTGDSATKGAAGKQRKDARAAQGSRTQTAGDQVHRDIAGQARTGTRQARKGARQDSTIRVMPRTRARSRNATQLSFARSSNWRHDGSSSPSG